MKLAVKAMLLLMIFTVGIAPVWGQVETGAISGTVRDTSGAAVAGATVTVRNTATSAERTVTTGDQGQYTITALPPGIYELTVTSTGFAKFTSRVEVTVGSVVTVDPQLSVSNQTTTIEVVAAGGVEVNTQNQELSQIVNSQQMAELPSLTRNPYDFVQISGNVSGGDRTASGFDQNQTNRGAGVSINGQRSSGTEILLDGVENVETFTATVGEQVPLDSVQEFRVVTSDFDAQYGRASGGVVNVSTKSGTNTFHGGLWEFNRLSAYTANTFNNAVSGAPKGHYTRNQFGYDVGGPILKNKLFFFQSTEWLRVRSNAILQDYVPTPQLIAASAPNVQAYFNAFGNNSFNFASTVTAGSLGIPGVPASTPAFGLVNFGAPSDAGGGLPQNTYRIMGRLDFNLNNSTQMFFRYALENLVAFNGGCFSSPYSQYNVGNSQYNNQGLFTINHSFGAPLYSSSKIAFSRLNIRQTYDLATQNVPELLMNAAPINIGSNPIQLPGLFAQFAGAGGLPFGGPRNSLQLYQDFSWTKGAHTVRFGGAYNYQQLNVAFGAFAQALEQLGTDAPSAFSNFVSGNLSLFQVAVNPQGKFPCRRVPGAGLAVTPECTLTLPTGSPSFARSYRFHDWAAYLEDSWRVKPRFTFNYGFRYEYFGVQHNNNQRLDSNFYFGPGSSYFEQVRNGSVQIAPDSPVHGLWNPNYGTIAPRIGFAWDIFGDGKTSLRGGYGITYERNFGNVTFNVIQNPPAYASVQIVEGTPGLPPIAVTTDNLGPFAGSSGSVPLRPSSLRHVNQNIDTAQTQFTSLALERQIARNTVLALEWSGAHGIHLYDIAASNNIGGGNVYLGDPISLGLTRVNDQYTGINTRGTNGSSHYSGLNIRLESQNLHNTGLSLTANYTWAHSTDDLSSTFSDSTQGASNGIGNLGYLDPRHPRLDWGSSDFDVRHRLAVTPIYDLPFYKTGRGLGRQILGGWRVVGIFTVRTGTPFSIFDTTNSANASAGAGIPRYVPSTGSVPRTSSGTPVNVGPNQYTVLTLPTANSTAFDPNLATAAFPGGISDFGPYPGDMTGRNMFRGLSAWNLDAAITKSFAITERFRLEFRAEGFDVFNHHNFYILQTNLDAANFAGVPITVTALKGGLGTNNVTATNHDERRFGQFALRLTF